MKKPISLVDERARHVAGMPATTRAELTIRVERKLVRVVRIDRARVEEIFRLRSRVWASAGVALPLSMEAGWTDEHDDHAAHWACIADGKIVAAARYCIHDHVSELPHAHVFSGYRIEFGRRVASINRLAVDPAWRRRKLAHSLDQVRLDELDRQEVRATLAFVWKQSGQARLDALAARGFQPLSGQWVDEPPFGLALPLVRVVAP